jgi:pimeloyl-ACP methyl ester carboxylesterase
MKFFKWLGIIALMLIILYFLGPKPATPKYVSELPAVPAEPALLEKHVMDAEAAHKLKPDNEARIIWQNDSLKQKTKYSVAKHFACNLYLSRLADHGIDTTDAMAALTADKLWNSAKEAYAIGRQLGEKVILLATSSGATLALKLAAEYPEIAGLILLSPNIAINDPLAWVANNHWVQYHR